MPYDGVVISLNKSFCFQYDSLSIPTHPPVSLSTIPHFLLVFLLHLYMFLLFFLLAIAIFLSNATHSAPCALLHPSPYLYNLPLSRHTKRRSPIITNGKSKLRYRHYLFHTSPCASHCTEERESREGVDVGMAESAQGT